MKLKRLFAPVLLSGMLWHTACSAAEFAIREAGVTFQLPAAWQAKVEEGRLPTGQLMQRWVREPVRVAGGEAMPGMVALATPIRADANLALVTQQVLAREPYRMKLAAETECIKCMKYKLRLQNGTVGSIAPDSSSACDTIVKSGDVAECSAEPVNLVGLKLEPSWVHRFEMRVPGGLTKVVLIHAIVGGKLLDVTFWYPPETAGLIEDEIGAIISSMRGR
jgi:hypothetical protein